MWLKPWEEEVQPRPRVGALHTYSLSACRVFIGCVVLWDLARRSVLLPWFNGDVTGSLELEAFSTDQGIVPIMDTPHRAPLHRVLFMRGSYLLQALLSLVHAACTLAMVLGVRTSTSIPMTWLLTACLHGRNEYVIDCGDRLCRSVLFWLALLPCDRAWTCLSSNRGDGHRGGWYTSPATWGLHMQVAALYWCALVQRLPGQRWYQDLSAVWYSLQDHRFARIPGPGAWILRSPELCATLTVLVVVAETVAPLLLFVSPSWRRTRILALLAFAGMQIGFGTSLRLETFPLVSFFTMICFCPPHWFTWTRQTGGSESLTPAPETVSSAAGNDVKDADTPLPETIQPGLRRRRGHADDITPAPADDGGARGSKGQAPLRSGLTRILALFFLVYLSMLNLGDVGLVTKPDRGDLGEALRLNQWWVMFSPDPRATSGWPLLEAKVRVHATLRNGTALQDHTIGHVDMMAVLRAGFDPCTPLQAVSTRPAAPAYLYRSFRWQKFISEISERSGAVYQQRAMHFGKYLCRKWVEQYDSHNIAVRSWDEVTATTEGGSPLLHPVCGSLATAQPASVSLQLMQVSLTWHEEALPAPEYTHWPWTLLPTAKQPAAGPNSRDWLVFSMKCHPSSG